MGFSKPNFWDTAISKKNLFFTVFEIYMQNFHREKKNIFENFFFRLAENFSSYGFFAKNGENICIYIYMGSKNVVFRD